MKPQDLSKYLKSIASYAETNRAPSRRAIVAGLQKALASLNVAGEVNIGQQEVTGTVTKLVDQDLAEITSGFESLIERLQKAVKTLNPQSQSKAEIEKAISSLQSVKAEFTSTLNEINQIEV
jgi:ABC-type phosphate transport system auxiliary subunit